MEKRDIDLKKHMVGVELSDIQKVLGSVQVFLCEVQVFSQYSRFLPKLIGDPKVPVVMDKTMNAL